MGKDQFIFHDERHTIVYDITDSTIDKSNRPQDKVKKVIISDSLLDLKIIKIPVVAKRLLSNLVLNTIKKHSTVIPSFHNTDYKILQKVDNQYEVLTFIKRYEEDDLSTKKQIYSVYHIIENIIKNKMFDDENAVFIINIDKTWFKYTFSNMELKRRDILFHDDIAGLDKENIFYLDLDPENRPEEYDSFKPIPSEILQKAISSLKKNIFKEKKALNSKIISSILLILLLICALGYLQLTLNELKFEKQELDNQKTRLEKKYKEEKNKRGISDERYSEFLSIISKQSHTNDFFYYLYLTCRNNVEITKLHFEKNKFVISGFCKDDSKLENAFRNSKAWRYVSFSFSRKSKKISFNIKGEFVHEQ